MEEQTFNDEDEIFDADSEQESNEDEFDSSNEDGEAKNSDDFLSKASKIAGREFKDEADFEKHYKNLASYVGKKTSPVAKKVENNDRVAELEFKVDHPEYKEHFDLIKMVSKEKGITYNDAISDSLVKDLIEVRQSKKGESVIHSNNKISSSNSNSTKLKANVHTEDGLAAYLQATLGE